MQRLDANIIPLGHSTFAESASAALRGLVAFDTLADGGEGMVMAEALYRRWRPRTWEEIVGQDHIVLTLRNAVKGDRVAHAFLFSGPRGTGKTTTARVLAKAVNCLVESLADRPCNVCANCVSFNEGRFLDLVEIDAASNTSVEDVRNLRDKINFAPNEGRFKVYIVDEVHMLSTAAFNALLKTLEEPPRHAIFILATTEVHKIPATVLSRCQRHEFRRLPLSVITNYLKAQCAKEGLKVDEEALVLIARLATGSLRDAISLLDQLASTGETVDLPLVQEVAGTATTEAVRGVVRAMIDGERAEGLKAINRALEGGADPRQFARQVVSYLRLMLLVRMGAANIGEAPSSEQEEYAALAKRLGLSKLLEAIRAFERASVEGRATWLPNLALELAFIESTEALPSDGAAEPEKAAAPAAASAASPQPEKKAGGLVGKPSAAVRETQPRGSKRMEAQPAQDKLASAGEPSFTIIQDSWPLILKAAYQRNPTAQALLNSSKPLGLKGKDVVLAFDSELLVDKMNKQHNLEVARAALQDVLGVALDVRCVVRGRDDLKAEHSSSSGLVEEGGMVATALRDLGAQVVEVTPDGETSAPETQQDADDEGQPPAPENG
jgi:DNA polymerase-3 subunit gamma/tau